MIGTKLSDRYEIVGELGRGGMGVVYRAQDPVLGREVAVKLVPPTHVTADTEERFRREAQLVAQMDHPGIVPIHDFGRHGDALFLVMPVVPGSSLRSALQEGALLLGDVVEIGIQAADALHYSHTRGVVHRDVKPENLMVARHDGTLRVRVMDFGLAMMEDQARMTQTGAIVGTMGYLSPEQVLSRPIDQRTDIYSLGTVLYECLVGSSPFAGEMQSVLYRIVHEAPRPPSALGATIDPELESIVLTCLARDPARRHQDAHRLVEALRHYRTRLRESDRSRVLAPHATTQGSRPVASPFVGRERELATLQHRLAATIDGDCQFVLVGGEPGTGKTRLLDELEGLARARHVRVLHGRFVEQSRALPYQGFHEAIQEFFRRRETESSSQEMPDFSDLAAGLVSLFPMLGEVPQLRASGADAVGADAAAAQGPENRTQIFDLLARTILRLAGGKPLALFLEDLHDAELSLDALQYIVPRLGQTPTMVVGTYRSSDVDRRHPLHRVVESFETDRRFESLVLGPFTPSEHRLFLATLVGGPDVSDELVRQIHERTEGNPFFTKELVRSLLDSNAISKDETDIWNLSAIAGVGSDALPATIQQAVERRIHRLPAELHEVLALASVIGRSFDFRDLEALAETSDDLDVDDAVDRLLAEGLLEEERESRGDRLAFTSGVVRDVLYSQISRRKRRSRHRTCAENLERRLAGRLERAYPQLVWHFSEGDVPEKTVEYGLALARRSLDAFGPDEAVRAARTALEYLDDEWAGERVVEGEARLLLARALRMAGDVDAALREFDAAAVLLSTHGRPEAAVDALRLAAETAWQARRAEDAGRLVERGLALAGELGEPSALRELLALAATLANLRGESERADAYLDVAERLAAARVETDASAEQIPRGGRLVVALTNPLRATLPCAIDLQDDVEVLTNVFETLLGTDDEGNLVPRLCERWRTLGGGAGIRLQLRPDVRFHDGSPLTAAAVAASIHASARLSARRPPTAFASIAGFSAFAEGTTDTLSGVEAVSDLELEIRLAEPLAIYAALLADHRSGIFRTADDGGVVGTGPFREVSREGSRVVLARNEEHWRHASPPLDEVEFRAGLAAAEIAAGLLDGRFDVGHDLAPSDLERVLRDPRFRGALVELPRKNSYFVAFRCGGSSRLAHASARRALAGVVRTGGLVWHALGRFAQPATGLLPPCVLGHDPGRKLRGLRLDEAHVALAQAGVEVPTVLRAAVHPFIRDRFQALLDALFSAWAELGVSVEPVTPDLASFMAAWSEDPDVDLLITRWNPDYDDPDSFTHGLFHSRVGQLRGYFGSPETDALLDEARTEARPAVRQALYRRFEAMLSDAAAVIPLFHDIDYRIAGPAVRGLALRNVPPCANYEAMGKVALVDRAAVPATAAGSLSVPIAGALVALDPALAYSEEQAEVLPCVFETLTRDAAGARIVPWLAASFHSEEGGRRYRFRLRNDVFFHDGRRLGARDVRYSYERFLQSRESESRFLLSPIRGAKALLAGSALDLQGFTIHSPLEFSIELEKPVSFFPALLSFPGAAVVPEGTALSGDGTDDPRIGTGPYRVVEFEPGRRLDLERNPRYWRQGLPKTERLTFSFGLSPRAVASEFRAGRLALASDLLPADVEALRREPTFAAGYRETPRLSTYYVVFNAHSPALTDAGLRRRIAQRLDAPTLVRRSLGRSATPATRLIPPGLLPRDGRRLDVPGTADARGGAAPVLTGKSLRVALHPVFFDKYEALARLVLDALRGWGAQVDVVNANMVEYVECVTAASVDVAIGRWAADYPDADTCVHGPLHSKEGFYGRLVGSAPLDRVIDAARTDTNPAVRHGLYRKIEEVVAHDALLAPLFHEQVYRFARPEVEGLTVSYWCPVVRYEELRIRSGQA